MNAIAFLSMDDLGVYICDDDLVAAPLRELGWSVETVSWRDRAAHWERYDAVIIRSTWDYQKDLAEFLEVLAVIDSKSVLANSLNTVRWNADKMYLQELEERGARIVPTLWGQQLSENGRIATWCDALATDEIVVKPTVSASANNTFRLHWDECPNSHFMTAFTGKPVLVQPFMPGIIDEGEYSLFYFSGVYSHAILKRPAPGDFRVQEEYNGDVQPVDPPDELQLLGQRMLQLLDELPLYARVDYVRDSSNQFALMELELIEPSLYFRMASGSAERFAEAVHTWALGDKR